MDTALLVGLAHKGALKRRMDVVAHNLANMSTTAFKKENVNFKQHLMDAPGATATSGGKISYVIDFGVVRDMDQGTMQNTGNPLDVFIDGKGFLSVQSGGETLFTRNGRMAINKDDTLTLLSGEPVLDNNGQRIQFDDDDDLNSIYISEDGVISTNNGEVARLAVSTFANPALMKKRGGSLYETNEAPQEVEAAIDVALKQRAVESSNVNPVEAMVEMIDVLRAYEKASRNSSSYEEMRKDSLGRLSKVQ